MVFTLRTGIDFLFQPFKAEDSEEVSVLIAGTDTSSVHLSIYDSFSIGTFKYQPPNEPDNLQLAAHASHRAVSTHTLLFRPEDKGVLEIVPMDLSFVASSPINLSLLASKLTTLQKLLRYVRQCFLHMQVEYGNSRELPSRFLASVQEDLRGSENGPRDIVAALYHTLVTGHTYEVVREWLVDSLAERVRSYASLPSYLYPIPIIISVKIKQLTRDTGPQTLGQSRNNIPNLPPLPNPPKPPPSPRAHLPNPIPPPRPRRIPPLPRRHGPLPHRPVPPLRHRLGTHTRSQPRPLDCD